MTDLRQAAQMALEALERGRPQIIGVLVQQDQDDAIEALRAALAQQVEQQPVAWMEQEWSGSGLKHLHFERREPTVRDEVVCPVWTPLYAGAAPAAQPKVATEGGNHLPPTPAAQQGGEQ